MIMAKQCDLISWKHPENLQSDYGEAGASLPGLNKHMLVKGDSSELWGKEGTKYVLTTSLPMFLNVRN